jgi:hypothetical protein
LAPQTAGDADEADRAAATSQRADSAAAAAAEAADSESDDEVEITGGDPPPLPPHQPMRRTVQMRITRDVAGVRTLAEASDDSHPFFNGAQAAVFPLVVFFCKRLPLVLVLVLALTVRT